MFGAVFNKMQQLQYVNLKFLEFFQMLNWSYMVNLNALIKSRRFNYLKTNQRRKCGNVNIFLLDWSGRTSPPYVP